MREIYERMLQRLSMYGDIAISVEQARQGHVQDAMASLREMRKKYDL